MPEVFADAEEEAKRTLCARTMLDPETGRQQDFQSWNDSPRGLSRPPNLPTGEEPLTCRQSCFGTGNLRALWGLFSLTTLFAIAQLIGARLANSLSMVGDSGAMLVDSCVYLVNIVMERHKVVHGYEASRLWEVYVSFLSVTLLVIITSVTISSAALRLIGQSDVGSTVDGRIVMGFSIFNLLLDVLMCFNYCFQLRHRRRESWREQIEDEAKEQLNMMAAFVHLFADTLRSLTSLTAGVLEQDVSGDALHIDAISTFVVCSVILAAAAFVFIEGILQLRDYLRNKNKEQVGLSDTPYVSSELAVTAQAEMSPPSRGVELKSLS